MSSLFPESLYPGAPQGVTSSAYWPPLYPGAPSQVTASAHQVPSLPLAPALPVGTGRTNFITPQAVNVPLGANALQSWLATIMRGDPSYVGQTQALIAQLQGQYQGSVLTPIEQALSQYGETPSGDILKTLQGIAAPTWQNAAGKTVSLGPTIGDALGTVDWSSASANPFSTLNMIKTGQGLANTAGAYNVAARGMGNSGGLEQRQLANAYNAEQARYIAGQNLLSGINQTATGFASNLNQAAQTQQGITQAAQQNVNTNFQSGVYGLPTTPKLTPTGVPVGGRSVAAPSGRAPGGGYFQSGSGTTGAKPLY